MTWHTGDNCCARHEHVSNSEKLTARREPCGSTKEADGNVRCSVQLSFRLNVKLPNEWNDTFSGYFSALWFAETKPINVGAQRNSFRTVIFRLTSTRPQWAPSEHWFGFLFSYRRMLISLQFIGTRIGADGKNSAEKFATTKKLSSASVRNPISKSSDVGAPDGFPQLDSVFTIFCSALS